MEQLSNDFTTTLAAPITTVGQSVIQVASSTGAPGVNFRIRIENELMLVTAVAHPNWTVTRGIEGTTPATHVTGLDIAHIMTKGGLDQFLDERGLTYLEQIAPVGMQLIVEAGEKLLIRGSIDVAGTLDIAGSVESI